MSLVQHTSDDKQLNDNINSLFLFTVYVKWDQLFIITQGYIIIYP